MAYTKLTDDLKDKILADYHIGKSQNQLAKDYNYSPATINKICKGIEPKYKDKVNTVVAIKSELAEESEYQSECFDKEVNNQLRRKNLVYGVQEKAIAKAGKMLDEIDVPQDLKHLVDAVDKASITLGVSQRHSNQNINVNTQNNMHSNTSIELSEDEAKKKALELGVPLSALI